MREFENERDVPVTCHEPLLFHYNGVCLNFTHKRQSELCVVTSIKLSAIINFCRVVLV